MTQYVYSLECRVLHAAIRVNEVHGAIEISYDNIKCYGRLDFVRRGGDKRRDLVFQRKKLNENATKEKTRRDKGAIKNFV